jgi:hypothetical protein
LPVSPSQRFVIALRYNGISRFHLSGVHMSEVVDATGTLLAAGAPYPLHLLGWKAFQDLCVSVAEECLRRPVQNFLPGNDAGRDGAFVGRWDGEDPAAGESTIQCKFTSKANENLTLSKLDEELSKASLLADQGLASDYIILTNHPITGASEISIKAAFEKAGVGKCRVFGYDFIVRQIKSSPRLRMMAPRLYGLGDLSDLLDARAYAQTQLILSAMGDDLQRLVVTDAHRRSVRAISEHNLVLLLGAPAAGKSTIGASLAIGAADIWQCETIRATSPDDIQRHLNPSLKQFFWIDDAWGNTQYQNQTAEAWNKVFPLMQGSMRKGTRFLITSRDYIWHAAQRDLKLQALPVLGKSQVIINVQELKLQEKAQILYNHLKLGDQPLAFRHLVKDILPELAELRDFLPETARRLGSNFFAGEISATRTTLIKFFEEPQEFLLQTINNLAADCRAAIALIFMNGGNVRSPVSLDDLTSAAEAFGVSAGSVRVQIEALNGSLLLLVKDEEGMVWRYKHPTIGDAFAKHVASSPELVEVYLRGAKPDSILSEVVCAGVEVYGAPVVIPDSLHPLLAARLQSVASYHLVSFLTRRSNRVFTERMLEKRPDVLNGLRSFISPIKDDSDASFLATLHVQGLLPEPLRLNFVKAVKKAAIEEADASFLETPELGAVLTENEHTLILSAIDRELMPNLGTLITNLGVQWDVNYPPDEHFDQFQKSIKLFSEALSTSKDYSETISRVSSEIRQQITSMNERFEPPSPTSAPTSSSTPASVGLASIFRDVDE